MLKFLKEKAGYVSIETIVVAGLMLALGFYAISNLFDTGKEAADSAIAKLGETADLIGSLDS